MPNTNAPYGLHRAVRISLKSYAARIGLHSNMVKKIPMMHHSEHSTVKRCVARRNLGVAKMERYKHSIEILVDVIEKKKKKVESHSSCSIQVSCKQIGR